MPTFDIDEDKIDRAAKDLVISWEKTNMPLEIIAHEHIVHNEYINYLILKLDKLHKENWSLKQELDLRRGDFAEEFLAK